MGLFEDIIVKAKDAANTVGEKAGKFVDVSKLNLELAEAKSNLKGKFENLGKIVYGEIKNGCFNEKSIESEISEIDIAYSKTENLKNEIAFLKNRIVCKACGAENSSDALYCSKCGHTIEIKCTYKPEESISNSRDNSCECESCSDEECYCEPECHCHHSSSESDD